MLYVKLSRKPTVCELKLANAVLTMSCVVIQVVIVLTASPWQNQQSIDWLRSVRDARNRGIQIYSAGFGPSVRLPQLASIVRNPSRDASIMKSYDDRSEPTRKLVNEIARGRVSWLL